MTGSKATALTNTRRTTERNVKKYLTALAYLPRFALEYTKIRLGRT